MKKTVRQLCLAISLCTFMVSSAQARGPYESTLMGSFGYTQIASNDLIVEADKILSRAKELMAGERYQLAEQQISQLLGPKFQSILFPQIAVSLYLDMSLIYRNLGKIKLGLDYAKKASDISLTLKNDPYFSWPSLSYGIQYLKYWSNNQNDSRDSLGNPEEPLLEIVTRIDALLVRKQLTRDNEYLVSLASRLVFAYLELSYYLTKKSFRMSKADSAKILAFVDRSREIMKMHDLKNHKYYRDCLWLKVNAITRNNNPLEKQVAIQVLPIQRDLYEANKLIYGPTNKGTLLTLQALALYTKDAGDYEDSIEIFRLHYDLVGEVYGRYSPEALNSLEGLGLVYFQAGQKGLATSTRFKLIQDARKAYGSNSLEYKRVLVQKLVGLSALSDVQKSFVDQELKRLDSLPDVAVSSKRSFDVDDSNLVELLLNLDANKWTSKHYKDCYDLLGRFTKFEPEDKSDKRDDVINLSRKFVEAGKILHGENSFRHVQSLASAAFVVSNYDQPTAIKLYDQLLELSEKVFSKSPGRLSEIYFKGMSFGFSIGDYDAHQYLTQKYLETRLSYYKSVLPFMNSEDRLSVLEVDRFPFNSIYTSAVNGLVSGDVAAFAVINRFGLLGELEKQYSRVDLYDQEVKDLYSKLISLNSALSRAGLAREARAKLTRQRLELELILSQKYGFSPETIKLSEIKKNIPSNAVFVQARLIDNISLEDDSQEYIAILVFPGGDSKIVRIGNAAQIASLVSKLHARLQNEDLDYREVANTLREKVFSPIESHIREKDVFFVPDGVLHLLPLGLRELRMEGVGKISILNTARDFLESEDLKSKASSPIVVAYPDYGAQIAKMQASSNSDSLAIARSNIKRSNSLASRSWNHLPATKKEGDAVHSILGGRYLYGSNAAKEVIIDNAKSPLVLHIATHAFYADDDAPSSLEAVRPIGMDSLLRAGLVMAGANNVRDSSNSYLTALEISRLDLSATQLVTLSACDTALGSVLGSEGLFGLQRALSIAGAKSSLLSLWKVDDRSTADFMKRFYLKLARGMSRIDALEDVRREFRSHPVAAWRHPYYWAAFRLSGDTGPIPGI